MWTRVISASELFNPEHYKRAQEGIYDPKERVERETCRTLRWPLS